MSSFELNFVHLKNLSFRFVDAGGNVLLAGSGSNVGSAIRDIAADNGFEFTEQLIDHVNYDASLVSFLIGLECLCLSR